MGLIKGKAKVETKAITIRMPVDVEMAVNLYAEYLRESDPVEHQDTDRNHVMVEAARLVVRDRRFTRWMSERAKSLREVENPGDEKTKPPEKEVSRAVAAVA